MLSILTKIIPFVVDILPMGTTISTKIIEAKEKKNTIKMIGYIITAVMILVTMFALITGKITMDQFDSIMKTVTKSPIL